MYIYIYIYISVCQVPEGAPRDTRGRRAHALQQAENAINKRRKQPEHSPKSINRPKSARKQPEINHPAENTINKRNQ